MIDNPSSNLSLDLERSYINASYIDVTLFDFCYTFLQLII